MSEPESGAQRYDLFTRDNENAFVWRLRDEGLALEEEAIVLRRAGRWTRAAYSDIAAVTLRSGRIARSSTIASCDILLDNGGRVIVSNVNARGVADGFRDGVYRRFVVDLHKHLVASGTVEGIRFHSGFSQGRIAGLMAIGIVASVLFVALPVILLIATRQIQMLVALVFGAGLVVPLWRTYAVNQPGSYNPGAPPDLLP